MDYLNEKGRIFDIQRFSVHDGEGIRTIIFLKGCPLRCRWCCNPEGQIYDIQQMQKGEKIETIGKDTSVREIIEKIERDRVYYRRSQGGVTLSGGECMTQPRFATAILRACKDRGLTTAIETTSFTSRENLEMILPYVDCFLNDIKHMDSAKHKEFTGVSNEKILDNVKFLGTHAKGLIVRVPVIPGFNDTVEEISAISTFAAGLPIVHEIHLLPYHRLGKDKYIGLGRDYTMGDTPMNTKEKMELLAKTAEQSGLRCQIG